MGKSYPDRTNATGIWKISDIYKNKITDGTYPQQGTQTRGLIPVSYTHLTLPTNA